MSHKSFPLNRSEKYRYKNAKKKIGEKEMFEEWIFMGGFLLLSIFVSHICLNYLPYPINKVFRALAILGIVIHELCHVVMCVITNASIKNIKILEWIRTEPGTDKNNYDFSGRVEIGGAKHLTFLQALLIGLAPLMISFWLFFFLWNLLLTSSMDVVVFFLVIFVMISIVLSAAPSAADLACIPGAFQGDPRYSMYQIFLLITSIVLVWTITVVYQLVFFHEIIAYLLIMIAYYGIKYALKGFNLVINCIFSKNKFQGVQNTNYKSYMRRKYKPSKPRKFGFKETQW